MDKFEQLAVESQLAVAILGNADVTEIELLPICPKSYDAETVHDLAAQWSHRGLKFLGVAAIGVDGKPRTALAEPLDHIRIAALSQAFIAYCEVMLSQNIEQRMGDSLEFLTRLYAVQDPRPYPHAEA